MSLRACLRAMAVPALAAAMLWPAGCARRPSAPTAPPPPPTYKAGTTAAGIAIGGMTEAQAGHALRLGLKPLANRRLNLGRGKSVYYRNWSKLGIAPDVPRMLTRAWREPAVPLCLTADLSVMKRSIQRAARAYDIAPVAPRLLGEPGTDDVAPGKMGRSVDVPRTAEHVRRAVFADPYPPIVRLAVRPVPPPFSEDDLRNITVPVARFTTRYNPREASRTHNLRLVTQRLNGAFVKPGGVFSFNGWVGERRESDGFREAIVYKEGLMVRETAGGLCQVSSTLYNVALEAGLPIVERSQHSLTVTYVPLGRDATVYWGQRDLRFRNNTDTPLYFRAKAGQGRLTVEAWGVAPLDREVRVTSSSARRGSKMVARVYREIDDGKGKRRELVSEDIYNTIHRAAPARARRT